MSYIEPISNMSKRRINQTLHGRSVYRNENVPGHNVFNGYTYWANHGVGIGDALDLFAPAGTPVVACFDGVQTKWDNDTEKLEVIYLRGPDGEEATYAHINARIEAIGVKVRAGEVVGWLRGDLKDPHVHFEFWPHKSGAVAGASPYSLHKKLIAMFKAPVPPLTVKINGMVRDVGAWVDKGNSFADLSSLTVAMGGEIKFDAEANCIEITTK